MSKDDNQNAVLKKGEAPPPPGIGPDPDVHGVEQGLLEQARQIVDRTPEIRPEKVVAIKEALAQGTYDIDSRKLAAILITEMILKR